MRKKRKDKKMTLGTTTEFSTPTDNIETNTPSEATPLEDTVADGLEQVEVAENEQEEPQGGEESKEEEPKLLAGKYKTVEELEKGYDEAQKAIHKVSELQKQVETLTAKPAIVEPATGTIKPEIVQQFAQQIALGELAEYRDALHRLDSEVQAEVGTLLSNYQTTGDPAYLNQAKEYYGASFVGEVERLKTQRAYEIQEHLKAEQGKSISEMKTKFVEGIKTQAPVTWKFLNPESEHYNEVIAIALNNSIGNDVAEVEEDVKKLVEGVKKYVLAEAKVQEQLAKDAKKQGLSTGGANKTSGNLPTYAEVAAMSQEEYNKAYEKWGAKLLTAQ